jgi:alpha-galactosidase
MKQTFLVLAVGLFAGCGARRESAVVDGKSIRIEFDRAMRSRVIARLSGRDIALGPFTQSEYVSAGTRSITDFQLADVSDAAVRDSLGAGRRWTLRGSAPGLDKTVRVTSYDEFPRMAFFEVEYSNTGNSDLSLSAWTNNDYAISTSEGAAEPAFWSYQPGSYEKRPDWLLPVAAGFQQENYLGMNSTDYGGGTPVADIWRRDAALAVGHVETAPKLVSLPVSRVEPGRATVAVRFKGNINLKPGQSFRTFRTFASVHLGDYFQALADYRDVMVRQGLASQPAPDDAFAPIWCAWGYGRKVKPAQIYNALPVVKKIGFRWVTVDDGYQTAEGDWFLDPKKFPNGDRDMKAIVDRIHADGFKAQLWWAPLAADPGTELLTKHPEMLLLNADGSKQKITWWDSWYLCPADRAVVQHHTALVTKMMKDWGFDGLKLDGQHMNGVPPCYNPAHHHTRPEDSVEGLPRFFEQIYRTARSIKPDALVEFCPCGTSYSFFTLPFVNMTVASDPGSSWQVRLKGKTLKALAGDSKAYFGDHVEMSEGGDDFASTIGIGGVVGTNFTWPPGSAGTKKKLDLTPEKERTWAKWVGIYKDKMLSRGTYLGTLYDIGFDRPEAHAIEKSGKMYYAFYAPRWDGNVELRGLNTNAPYRLTDYESGKDLGTVRGPNAPLHAQFTGHLLLEASPESPLVSRR